MKAKLLLLVSLALCLGASDTHAQRRARAATDGAAAVAAPLERTPARAAAAPQALPIRRVILYSNGVAYVERRGTVTGHAEGDLSFKQ